MTSYRGIFAEWQPRYAAHGIATFPVREKVPAVSNYLKMGIPASKQLAIRFPTAQGLGFACGKSSGITVVDVDTPDERLLADALDEFGHSPFVVRSGSGNHQVWYRHSGERRRIRADKCRPIDILGGGYVVAPPSRVSKGDYSIIQGSLDDLANLPPLRVPQAAAATPAVPQSELTPAGKRNDTLWRICMTEASSCAGGNDLLAFAVQANRESFEEPVANAEVVKIAASAWAKEAKGENFFGGRRGLIIPNDQVDALLATDPDAFILFVTLKRHHWGREFVCANAMAAMMPPHGWSVKRFSAARKTLERESAIVTVRGRSRYSPALYQFKSG